MPGSISSCDNKTESVKTDQQQHLDLTSVKTPYDASFKLSSNVPGVSDGANTLMGDSLENFGLSKMESKLDESRESKQQKRESYKVQRKNYRREKKRVAKELLSALENPSIIILDDWLKIRGTLKGWTKLWCVLKPSVLMIYKSPKTEKSSQWVGTVLLNTCEVIERPSKKDGFCFKLFHPLEHSIWATRGPKGETIGALVQPMPISYLILRSLSEPAGKCWLDAFELAMKCSSLLMRSFLKDQHNLSNVDKSKLETASGSSYALKEEEEEEEAVSTMENSQSFGNESNMIPVMNESDCEKHFKDHDLADDAHTDKECAQSTKSSDSDSDAQPCSLSIDENDADVDDPDLESNYVNNPVGEEFGVQGDAGQTEEFADENKSLVWTLVKQIRPGMDLSKVVLPTFILEPRSFLDKLTDFYYHCDLLSAVNVEDDPFNRMKTVVKFYLSGFYKKPKGIKKPYNPILGETFRCFWKQDRNRAFYVAEQVSHHPPVSAFYVTNRQEGFSISGSILAKSKFYGNSLSAILDGQARLTLLTRGEDYILTMPYVHCKGIVMGTLTSEMGGKVKIECQKTGYRTDIEFKLKPFLAGNEQANVIHGKMKLGSEVLATIHGRWDSEISITDKRTGDKQIFWNPTPEIRSRRLKRYVVPLQKQDSFESERLWQYVTEAINNCDQVLATEEKTILEDAQRQATKERKAKLEEWNPKYFERNLLTGEWIYRFSDLRPWDQRNDVYQYENEYVVKTKTRHRAPIVVTNSIININDKIALSNGISSRSCSVIRIPPTVLPRVNRDSCSSDRDVLPASDSSDSERIGVISMKSKIKIPHLSAIEQTIEPIQLMQNDLMKTMESLQRQINSIQYNQQRMMENGNSSFFPRELLTIFVVLIVKCIVERLIFRS